MKTLSLIFVMLFNLSLGAQNNYELNSALDFYRSSQMEKGEVKNILSETDIEGSPYLNYEFINGNVYTKSKTQYTDIPLRYNIYNDEVEFKSLEGSIEAITDPETIEKVTVGDNVLVYIPYLTFKKTNQGFFKLITDGPTKLYARANIQYKEPVPAAPYKDAEPAKFVKKEDTYYIRFGEEAAQLIENKKDLVKVFPDHKKEIAAFIKNNKINHRKEDKLKELVDYYNTL